MCMEKKLSSGIVLDCLFNVCARVRSNLEWYETILHGSQLSCSVFQWCKDFYCLFVCKFNFLFMHLTFQLCVDTSNHKQIKCLYINAIVQNQRELKALRSFTLISLNVVKRAKNALTKSMICLLSRLLSLVFPLS